MQVTEESTLCDLGFERPKFSGAFESQPIEDVVIFFTIDRRNNLFNEVAWNLPLGEFPRDDRRTRFFRGAEFLCDGFCKGQIIKEPSLLKILEDFFNEVLVFVAEMSTS